MSIRFVLTCLALAFLSQAAEAQGLLRFVSTAGNDANLCTRAQPCRTLQRAVNVVPASGEIQVLDSGEFGVVYITKSVAIVAEGVSATIAATAPGSVGVIVNESSAEVSFRGLRVLGGGTGDRGIVIRRARAAQIIDCYVQDFMTDGIQVFLAQTDTAVTDTFSLSNGGNGLTYLETLAILTVSNSYFQNNALHGIVMSSVREITAKPHTITNTVTTGNAGTGVLAAGGPVTVTGVNASRNGEDGFATSREDSILTIESSIAIGNVRAGLRLGASGSVAVVSNSTFQSNATGIDNTVGTVRTRENNTVSDNGVDVAVPGTLVSLSGI